MKYILRFAWYLGNWSSQIGFAFRDGRYNGRLMRPQVRPIPFQRDGFTQDDPRS